MNYKLITLFNKAISQPCDLATFKAMNEKAMKAGYLIHPDCCTPDVDKFLDETAYNPNSTFYKTFEDVLSKNRLELAFDQWRHYASTYGSGYAQEGNGFVQNDEPAVLEFDKYKVIMPASEEDIFNECYGMLKSGIALHKDTLNLLMEFIKDYNFLGKVDVDEISNKEAQAIFAVETGALPKQPISVLRVIMYLLTDETAMLVKSKQSIERIRGITQRLTNPNKLNDILEKREKELSSIFYRYKPIFLAMKVPATAATINKIRKLAVKNHKPMKVGFWERCLDPKDQENAYIDEATKKVGDLTAFKKAQLMQGITERLNGKNIGGRMFVIRNGKTFVREDYNAPCNTQYLAKLYSVLEDSYVNALKTKAVTRVKTEDAEGKEVILERPTRISIPKGLELTVPTSEKNFVGNYPMGTAVPLGDEHNVIGIYWRNEWGVRDYDLHVVDKNCNHYGWNSSYNDKNGKIVYSGDMTNADPEAAECFYFSKKVPDGLVSLYKFNGNDQAKFKLFVAVDPSKANMQKKERNYHDNVDYYRSMYENAMVDPNTIVFEAELNHEGNGEKTIAEIKDGKLYMSNMEGGGHVRVPSVSMTKIIEKQNRVKAESYIQLKPLLEKAGFEIVEQEADLDFSQMSKNDLIKLLQ